MKPEWIERILVRELTTLEKEVAAAPTEETLWATPAGITNSIGTLTLHLCGNLQHFIGAVLGKTGYQRQRDLEFSARDLPRSELLARIAETKRVVSEVLARGAKVDFEAQYGDVVGGMYRVATGDWLINLVAHLGFHVGQVGYLRRILTGDSRSSGGIGIAALATAVKIDPPS
jgi:hypothetical protein